ncbi:hypothetical protein IKE67_00595 [bacterium]|nr:hypothetical protein [bacterium]
MFKLLSLIKKDDNFIILGLLFGFVCIGSTLTMLLMRPYALQECLFIIVNYTLILLWKKIKNNEKLNIKDICLYSLVFSLFLQTGYFTLIYAGIVFVFTIIALILYKKSYYLKNFLLISSLAIIFTWICYPGYFDFHTDNEHIETVSKAANSFNWTVLKNTAGNLLEYLKAFIIYPVIFIPLLILFIYGKLVPSVRKFLFDDRILAKEQLCICLSIISFCIMWAIISCYIAPYPTFRYIAAASVFFALLSAMLSYNFKRYIQILILIVYFICSINTSKLNIYPQYHYTIGGLQVPFLITKNHESAFFNNIAKQNIPVIVVPKHWYNVNYFIYFDNSQKIKFEDTDYINSSEYSEYIIITNGYVYKQSMNNVVNNMGNSSIKNK